MNRQRRIAAEQSLYISQQAKIKKPDVYGLRQKRVRKLISDAQQQKQDNDDDEFACFDSDEPLQLASDTINTAELLIRMNPKSNIPLCFVHQIYSILPNNTLVDRELREAIKENTWRKFQIIGSLEDEFLIMKTSDYCDMINKAKADDDEKTELFDKFEMIIMNAEYNKVSIKKHDLMKVFKDERDLAQLVSSGFLLPHSTQLNLYWFSVKSQGSFMSNLSGGRIELLRIIKKRNSKDIMEKLLKQKKLHKTIFNFEFLMHDLVGSGRVEMYSTAMGNLIRLTNKGEKGI